MRASTMELLVVLIVVLVIFGPKQLPKLAKMIGKSTKAFKEGVESDDDDDAEAAPVKKAAKKEDSDEGDAE